MARIETKVQAASLSAALSGVALWVLNAYVFKGSAVPAGLVSLVDLAVPAVCAAAAGYLAPHTPRPRADPLGNIFTGMEHAQRAYTPPGDTGPVPPLVETAPAPSTGPVPPPVELPPAGTE